MEGVNKRLQTLRETERLCEQLCIELFQDLQLPRKKACELVETFVNFGRNLIASGASIDILNVAEKNVFSTEYNFFERLSKKKIYFPPVNVELGQRRSITKALEVDDSNFSAQIIPIKSTIQILFQDLSFTNGIVQYKKSLETSKWCENIVQTDQWKKLYEVQNDRVLRLPIVFTYDDFQPLTSIGVHSSAYSVGAGYLRFACLPPTMASKLDYILPITFFYTGDRKEFGSQVVFKFVVEELCQMCGPEPDRMIKINHSDYDYAALILYVLEGDNKSIAEAAGFMGASAKYPCNRCMISIDELKITTKLDLTTLRTIESYEYDLAEATPYDTGEAHNNFP